METTTKPIRTIIYSPIGYWGSYQLWRNAAHAYRSSRAFGAPTNPAYDFFYMGVNKQSVTNFIDISMMDLPDHDYEYIELDENGQLMPGPVDEE